MLELVLQLLAAGRREKTAIGASDGVTGTLPRAELAPVDGVVAADPALELLVADVHDALEVDRRRRALIPRSPA